MKLYVICVAYEKPVALRLLIDSFLLQHRPDWDLTIIHDGPAELKSGGINDIVNLYWGSSLNNCIHYIERPKHYGQWGHPNRRWGIEQLPDSAEDFVLLTNDDNYYVPRFVDFMLSRAKPDVGMVYCDTVHSYMGYNVLKTRLVQNFVDCGSFITRVDVAKTVGFTDMFEQADGRFAERCVEECKRRGLRTVYVGLPLFVHN